MPLTVAARRKNDTAALWAGPSGNSAAPTKLKRAIVPKTMACVTEHGETFGTTSTAKFETFAIERTADTRPAVKYSENGMPQQIIKPNLA
mmetsp:Transcript_75232/g.138582  ORF Transcript_75232/g.138582 Transcript_75232/m.138582 type:complete len:90 (+) Transcript_75232:801-1070(+)